MKVKIHEYEVEVRAKGYDSTRFNKQDTLAFLCCLCVELINAKDHYKEEGFDALAEKFKMVAAIEKSHEQRYQKLIDNINNNEVFSKECEHTWQCRACGHKLCANAAPESCPVCSHPKAFYQIFNENY